MAVIGLVTIVALTLYMYRGSARILTGRELESLSGSIQVSETRFNAGIEVYRQDVLFLSETPPVTGIYRARADGGLDPTDGSSEEVWRQRLATIFGSLLKARPEYMQVRYIGLQDNGREIVRFDRLPNGELMQTPQDQLQSKGDRPYFIETAALTRGEVYISPIDLNQERGQIEVPHRPVVRVATPVFRDDGSKLGIVIINVNMNNLFGHMVESLPAPRQLYIANADGDYLFHPQVEKTFGFDLGQRYLIQDSFPALAGVAAGKESSFAGMLEGRTGQVLLVGDSVHYDPEDPQRFLLMAATMPANAISGQISSLRNASINFAGAILALGLLAVLWQVGRLVRPLNTISKMAIGIANGDRTIDIGALGSRCDEVGSLARSFQAMVHQVTARENESAARAEELNRANEELVRSNQEMSQFAYVASHDLQEPLRMVESYMALLARRYEGKLDAEADEFIGYAVDGAHRMKILIDELLQYSRVNNRPLHTESVDMNTAVAAVIELLDDKIAESHARIDVGTLPTIQGDPRHIERLLLNLIGNAIKYRSDAPPEIRITAERHGEAWEFSVADNGIGIDPKFGERVFEIFARLHSRDKYQGTGIGLASCKRIVERHGGNIRVVPAPDGGSVFLFTLSKPGH